MAVFFAMLLVLLVGTFGLGFLLVLGLTYEFVSSRLNHIRSPRCYEKLSPKEFVVEYLSTSDLTDIIQLMLCSFVGVALTFLLGFIMLIPFAIG